FMITNLDNFKDRYFSSISFSKNKNLNLFQIYLTSEYGSHSISSFLIFRDNFLLGVGNKNFRTACKNYENEVVQFQKKIDKTDRDLYPNGCGTHPHQIYNEFLSEHGILGSFIILFLISRLILKNFKINNNSNLNLVCFFYLILYFIPILPSGSFFSTLPSTFFWINYLFYIVNVRKYV
ncbi:O-antigen ligase family protein, partial [Candidatus Pelagibacter sp.]|uniref:O-antigen ligase family protein n=1 Tax=Candidatus Pelagibacter sp. TaxID=2024849 RepID=UPI003F863013